MELLNKLSYLEKQIQKYLSLHNNPYDTSARNEIAEKLKNVLSILEKTTPSSDNDTCNAKSIKASVGVKGENKAEDVKVVQSLLKLVVDGDCGIKTKKAIRRFQRQHNIKPASGLIEPNSPTWKALVSGKASDTNTDQGEQGNSQDQAPKNENTGNYKYYNHPNWESVKVSYGPRAVKLNYNAERLLKSILAKAGLKSGKVSSTLRTYADQARINYEQNTGTQIKKWYGADVYAVWAKYKAQKKSTADYAAYLEARDKKRGRVISNHIPGYALDVTPHNARFSKQCAALKPISGSGVKTFLVEKGCTHVEFTFPVTGGSSGSSSGGAVNDDDTSNTPTGTTIKGSVGKGGANDANDTKIIQNLLNKNGANVTVDGDCGGKTIAAISSFQSNIGLSRPDGLVEPNGATWKALSKGTNTPTDQNQGSNDTPSTDTNANNNAGTLDPALGTTSQISASVGSKGKNKPEDVVLVKKLLSKFGAKLTETPEADATLIEAIKKFQRDYRGSTNPDGRVDAGGATWNTLLGIGRIKGELLAVAKKYDIEPAVILAIQAVESRGNGFLPDGRPKILFEGHIFWRQLKQIGKNPASLQNGNESVLYQLRKGFKAPYVGGVGEYKRLERAMKIDKIAALKSASWGEFQIMGFNHAVAGYSDVESFVEGLKKPGSNHLSALMKYLEGNNLLRHVQGSKKDWVALARGYNGKDFKKNKYDTKLANAYARFSKIL